jgi:hypothetical protein
LARPTGNTLVKTEKILVDPDLKVALRLVPLPRRAADHPAMPDIISNWLWILDGWQVDARDLRPLKAPPEYLHHFDLLSGGNAERKGYGIKTQRCNAVVG